MTCEDENMKSYADVPDRNLSQFSVVLAIVDIDKSAVPIEFVGRDKIDSMIANIRSALRLIPIIERLRIHVADISPCMRFRQSYCNYNLSVRAVIT